MFSCFNQYTQETSSMGICSRKYGSPFFWLTEAIGILIVILTLVYIINYQNGFAARKDHIHLYNWHVFFMTLGFIYCFGNALLTFRFLPSFPKPTLKWIHLGVNGAVILCALLGFIFIVHMKNLNGRDHFQSLHSWVGLATMILLIIQFVAGVYLYMTTRAPKPMKETMMPWHVKIGITIFLLGALSILIVIGHGKTPSEKILRNFIGGFIIIFCFLVTHLLTDKKLKYGISSS